jgi:hypothetical protein
MTTSLSPDRLGSTVALIAALAGGAKRNDDARYTKRPHGLEHE